MQQMQGKPKQMMAGVGPPSNPYQQPGMPPMKGIGGPFGTGPGPGPGMSPNPGAGMGGGGGGGGGPGDFNQMGGWNPVRPDQVLPLVVPPHFNHLSLSA